MSQGQSTIDVTSPGQGAALSSSAIRANEQNAKNDINNVISKFGSPTAPANPLVGCEWINTSGSPYVLNMWLGSGWVPWATVDPINSVITPISATPSVALAGNSALNIVNAPVGGEQIGSIYIVGTSPTGTFANEANKIAYLTTQNTWIFVTPVTGMKMYVQNSGQRYTFQSSAWSQDPVPSAITQFAGQVACTTTATLPAYTYNNGVLGVGATLTGNANGALPSATFDGVTPTTGMFVGVISETSGNQPYNGRYVVTNPGSGSVPFVLTRTTDANTAALLGAMAFYCQGGTANIGNTYAQQLPASQVTVGTTALNFVVIMGGGAVATEAAARASAISGLQTQITGNTANIGTNTFGILQRPIYTPIWNDDPTPYVYVITDGNSNIVDGVTASGKKYSGNPESIIVQPLWADETYGLYAVTDPNNNLIYGQTLAGVAWPPPSLNTTDRAALNLAEATFGSIWDETYALPFTDSTGKLLLGLRRDGGVDVPKLNLNLTGWLPVINPTDGGLWAGNGSTEFKIAAPQGATALSSPPYLNNGIVQWLDSNVTPWEQREYNFSGAGNLPSGVTSALHVLQYGESTSVGANGGVGGLLTTSPVAPTQAFMFSPDHRTVLYPGYTAQADDGTKAFDAQQISLVSLQEEIATGQTYWGESHGSGLAYSIINIGSLATSSVTLHSSHGCSQEIVSRLGRGTQLYKNLERAVERAYALCKQGGVAYSIPGIVYVQGINDYATSEATWNAAVVTLQSNLTSDLNAITGASAQIPLFIVQYACWTCPTFGGGGQAAAPAQCQGMIDLYNANPTKIILVGNSYHLNYFGASGAVHMLAQGYRMQGEEIGRATSEAITGGVSSVTPPLFATACTASHGSSTLTVTFNNTTLLDIDTSIVTDPGQYGLRLTDNGGSPIALSSIVVVGSGANAQITATTASQLTIGGTYNLGIANYGTIGNSAGPVTGPRSCIRDSAPESYSALCGGGRMYRYACTQSIPVTVGA